MKQYLMLACCALSLAAYFGEPAQATAAEACVMPDAKELQTTWAAFRGATLAGHPEAVAKFYQFPIKLMGPMDEDKPLVISRAVFVKNYRELFQVGPAGDEIGLLADMKKAAGAEHFPKMYFDAQQCRYLTSARVRDYNFIYARKEGWRITSVFYGTDYWVAKEAELNK